jgi:nitroreductase
MNIDVAIKGRRSIRQYKENPVPQELISKILEAGTYAPSGKNSQPWRFQVFTGEPKTRLTTVFRSSLEGMKDIIGEKNMGSSFNTCSIMERAPVIVIVWNTQSALKDRLGGVVAKISKRVKRLREFGHLAALQGVSAAIQNMLLTAHGLGLGSLWIGDICYAMDDLEKHLGKPWELVAAVAIGWPTEEEASKPPRKRLDVDEVTEFHS